MYLFASRLRSRISHTEQLFLSSGVNPTCSSSSPFKTFSQKEQKIKPVYHSSILNSSYLNLKCVTAINFPTSNSFRFPSDFSRVQSIHTSSPDEDQGGEKPVPPSKPGIVAKMKTLKAQFKVMLKDYWYVLIPVHVATSIVWYGGFYMMCKSGIDMVTVLEAVGTSEKLLNPLRNSDAGYFALAYLCFKIASPFRYTVTVGGTGYTIRYLSKQGILKAADVKGSAREKASDFKDRADDFRESAREKASNFKDRADDFRESAREKTSEFKDRADDFRESAREKASEFKDRANDFRESAREKSSDFKDKRDDFRKVLEKGLQT